MLYGSSKVMENKHLLFQSMSNISPEIPSTETIEINVFILKSNQYHEMTHHPLAIGQSKKRKKK